MRRPWPFYFVACLFCALLVGHSQAAPTRGVYIGAEGFGTEQHEPAVSSNKEKTPPAEKGTEPDHEPENATAEPSREPPDAITVIEPEAEIVEKINGGEVRMALVLGISGYGLLPQLPNPANDARLVSETLHGIGFRVWRGIDLTYAETMATLRSFVAASSEADIVTFYFAGHAIQVDQRNYLFLRDASFSDVEDIAGSSIDMSSVIGLMETNNAANIVILDACRNNPLGSEDRSFVAAQENASSGLARMSARAGTLIAYAAAPDGLAQDGLGANSPFAEALARHLPTEGLPLELVMVRVRHDVVTATGGSQVPWSNSSLIRELSLVPAPRAQSDEIAAAGQEGRVPSRDSRIDWQDLELVENFLHDAPKVAVNGQAVQLRTLGQSPELGLGDKLLQGLNHLEAGTRRMKVWLDGQTAFVFPRDYDDSHALIIAIDEYQPETGFQPLGFMEDHARALAAQLERMGFPAENIVELYGPDATRDRIVEALDAYWGQRSPDRRDRLLIYYGGHGTHIERATGLDTVPEVPDGLLIPYDFNPNLPYQTGILLEELQNRNLKRSAFHHTLLLIDACSSGLIMRQYAGDAETHNAEPLTPSERWLRIKSSLENPHTAVIVAGTGEERALWENGGVFTKSIVAGLSGAADINSDGIINYDELQFHLSDRVRNLTAESGIQQSPANFEVGSGRFIFERRRF